jgi:hypothetical protein
MASVSREPIILKYRTILDLSDEEAQMLVEVLGVVGGVRATTYCRHSEEVYNKLREAGVVGRPGSHFNSPSLIYKN